MREYALLIFLLISLQASSQNQTLSGFTQDNAVTEWQAEQKFDSFLKASNLRQWMKNLSARPHHLGSEYGKKNAEMIRDYFRSWGYEAEIETFEVLFPTPRVRYLELTSPTRYKARLAEPALREDATSAQIKEQLPVYNCWSPDGDVSGELVFVNYGVPDDYEYLERLGIDVKGKIVIAKYGGSWRGIKPKVAQEHGAIGCILYSDPKEDGYFQGEAYPLGAYKSEWGTQRGSVLDLPVAPGDPLTPGYGATPGAVRINRSEAASLLKIPVLPISYGDAQPLLAALRGPVAPPLWRGALPITYHIGPGPARVHLKLQFDWKMVPCYNVVARLKGTEQPDQWVVRGNHHDAWVNGANDPVSGLVALMEEARAVSELVKSGWKPKRTILYCAWDGEEPGLIGSTEWAETHAQELQQKVVAYINSDSNTRGFLYASGSHTLETLMTEVARDVQDPQTNVSVLERSRSFQVLNAANPAAKKEIIDQKNMILNALGSGSDYSPFIQHLGIPSLDLGFGGEGGGGEYHSIYDSYDHYLRFQDPTFAYGIALAKTAGRATLRLANADRLPFNFMAFHRTVNNYLNEIMTLLADMRESTKIQNQMIIEKRYVYGSDPEKKLVSPKIQSSVPYLDLSALQNALAKLETATRQWEALADTTMGLTDELEKLNRILFTCEQKLLSEKGLPRRPWFRHTIYAPGFYTGYGVKTLPGIREAIEQRNWNEAQEQVSIAAKSIHAYTGQLETAIDLMKND
ncbi:MAG: transferrin receptor-like dimerization domain-containing protein [Cyclobacteriaceae bacterium]